MEEEMVRAKRRAMYLLGAKAYSKNDLYKKLRLNYEEDTCAEVVALMEEYGYINDNEYAEKLAAYLIVKKSFGKRRARFEMKQKGLDDELISVCLEQYDEDSIIEQISEVVRKKYADSLDTPEGRQRAMNALVRRGYGYDEIKKAIRTVREELEDSEN